MVEPANGGALSLPSTKAYWHCRHHVAFAIAITSNQLPSNRVSSAVAVWPMPTTYALPSHRHSAAGSVTSSLCRSAEGIIAKCIAAAMRPGRGLAFSRGLGGGPFRYLQKQPQAK